MKVKFDWCLVYKIGDYEIVIIVKFLKDFF